MLDPRRLAFRAQSAGVAYVSRIQAKQRMSIGERFDLRCFARILEICDPLPAARPRPRSVRLPGRTATAVVPQEVRLFGQDSLVFESTRGRGGARVGARAAGQVEVGVGGRRGWDAVGDGGCD